MPVPSVFITYSHDSQVHEGRVLALADKLREDGVEVRLDQYVPSPPQGWPRWVEQQVQECSFVVVVCTTTYMAYYEQAQAQAQRREANDSDDRLIWELMAVRNLLFAGGGLNARVIPVLFEGAVAEVVPLSLRTTTHYRLADGYEDLLRRLLDQPRRPPPELGPPRVLPPDPRPSFADLMKIGTGEAGGSKSVRAEEARVPALAEPRAHSPGASSSRAITSSSATSSSDSLPLLLVFTAGGSDDKERLRQDEELHKIRRAVRDRCRLEVSPMASQGDVVRDLDDYRPEFVHFSGHTEHNSGSLVLQSQQSGDQGRDEVFVKPKQLAEILAKLGLAPTLVIFTACFSTSLAEAAAKHAQFAIGFTGEYRDEYAPLFCKTFYEFLFSRQPLDVSGALDKTKLSWASDSKKPAEQAVLFAGPVPRTPDVRQEAGTEPRNETPREAPPRVEAPMLDPALRPLVNELARVYWEANRAEMFVLRYGFPRPNLPRFDTSQEFWERVAFLAEDGKLSGGVRTLGKAAATDYPGNEVFARYR